MRGEGRERRGCGAHGQTGTQQTTTPAPVPREETKTHTHKHSGRSEKATKRIRILQEHKTSRRTHGEMKNWEGELVEEGVQEKLETRGRNGRERFHAVL